MNENIKKINKLLIKGGFSDEPDDGYIVIGGHWHDGVAEKLDTSGNVVFYGGAQSQICEYILEIKHKLIQKSDKIKLSEIKNYLSIGNVKTMNDLHEWFINKSGIFSDLAKKIREINAQLDKLDDSICDYVLKGKDCCENISAEFHINFDHSQQESSDLIFCESHINEIILNPELLYIFATKLIKYIDCRKYRLLNGKKKSNSESIVVSKPPKLMTKLDKKININSIEDLIKYLAKLCIIEKEIEKYHVAIINQLDKIFSNLF